MDPAVWLHGPAVHTTRLGSDAAPSVVAAPSPPTLAGGIGRPHHVSTKPRRERPSAFDCLIKSAPVQGFAGRGVQPDHPSAITMDS